MKVNPLKLCVVGNLIGMKGGHVTSQGTVLADLFARERYDVVAVSSKLNRLLRIVDVIWTIVRNSRSTDVMLVEVYSGLGFVLADVASLLGKLFGIPSILVLHGGNLPDFAEKYPGWVKRVLRRARVLVSPSSFLASQMVRHGFPLQVIPNVIDLDDYEYRLRRGISPKLLWMRSFHPIYNPQMALDVLATMRREVPEATLVMAGVDKGLQDTIKKSAEKMGLADSVKFPGFLDANSKKNEFSSADIYLNTNRIDNMPVSVIEAMAMGLPVVSTDVGGLSHMIAHGRNGLLVKDGDAAGMANAIVTLLTDDEIAERLSRNGRSTAEDSGWPSVRKSWERLFRQVLDQESEARDTLPEQSSAIP